MRRREFLKLAAMSAAGCLLPAARARTATDEWREAFHAALREKPWLLGWLGVDRPLLETQALAIDGVWPSELSGSFYRNGPARHEVRGMRYRHWFDPDGMLHRYAMADGRVSHRGRMIETAKYLAEEAGGALRTGFGTVPAGTPPVTSADSINVANTSVLFHGGRLFALWEGGSPWELDPGTLATRGPHAWSEDTRGLPFTAHPRRDADGTLWAVSYALASGALVICQIDARGALVQAVPVPMSPVPMVHDFAVTARHLVIVLPPYAAESLDAPTVADSFVWRGSEPARVLLVDKRDLSRVRTLEMEAHFAFHYGNAWEDGDGTIRLDYARYHDAGIVSETFRQVQRGEWSEHVARHHRMTIPPAGAIREERLLAPSLSSEFPQIDRRRSGVRHSKVAMLLRDTATARSHPYFDSLGRLDLESGRLDRYVFPPDVLPEEHVFVPRDGDSEGAGFLLGTGLDVGRGVTQLSVFDAEHVADGPLAVARLPYPIPLGFHGVFVPDRSSS